MRRATFILALTIPAAGLGAAAATLTQRMLAESAPQPKAATAPQGPSQPRPAQGPQFPLPSSLEEGDRLYPLEIQRITLSPASRSRYLQLSILINCGQDSAVHEALTASRGESLVRALQEQLGATRSEELLSPSRRMDLRERMILLFNRVLRTTSIKDIYYETFIIS